MKPSKSAAGLTINHADKLPFKTPSFLKNHPQQVVGETPLIGPCCGRRAAACYWLFKRGRGSESFNITVSCELAAFFAFCVVF